MMKYSISFQPSKWLNSLNARNRLLICFGMAVVSFILLPARLQMDTRVIACWDIFSCCMIGMSWVTFASTRPAQIRKIARRQDESRTITFIIVLVATLASLFAILILLGKHQGEKIADFHTPISLVAVACSWLLVHTIFTLHYAHLYYRSDQASIQGLAFPEEKEPDYMDFAYFSSVIGMTDQVSDVNVVSRQMRRLVLLHGMISFVFNTIIVALSISIVSNLL